MTQADDLATRVASTANRLRLIQGQFAESDEGERLQYLRDELSYALGRERDAEQFLERLQKRFPSNCPERSASFAAPAPSKVAAPSVPAPCAEPVERSPAELVQELINAWGSMSSGERDHLSAEMQQAGLLPLPPRTETAAPPPPPPPPPPPESSGIEPLTDSFEFKVDVGRVATLMRLLIGELGKMDNCLTSVLEELSKYAGMSRPVPQARISAQDFVAATPLSRRLKDFLIAEEGKGRRVTEAQVKRDLERMRIIFALFVTAVNDVPAQIYARHLSPLEPHRIEANFKGWSKEKQCWESYKLQAVNNDKFRQIMLGSIIDHIEDCAPPL